MSGAVSAPTFSTPFVVTVFYEPSGRWRDVSFLTLHNGPAVKRGLRGRADVRMCADVCDDLVILAQRWLLDPYWYLCIVPNKHILKNDSMEFITKKGAILVLDTNARGGGGLLKCSEVLFLKPGRAIVTFASPLFPTGM